MRVNLLFERADEMNAPSTEEKRELGGRYISTHEGQ